MNVDLPEENVPSTEIIGHHGTRVVNDVVSSSMPRR
jgi:hypothetical protein